MTSLGSVREDRRGALGEVAIVFGLTVGVPLLIRLSRAHFISFDFGQERLLRTMAVEAICVSLLWPWLAARGWSFRAIAGAPEPRDVWRGVLLALAAWLAGYLSAMTWIVFVPGSYETLRQITPQGDAAAWVVLLVAVVNPVVEEFLWLGYGITALKRYGIRTAVIVSLALRVTVHLYQGQLAFISVLPLTLVFTIYYVRTNRLWPVIVAHMLFDAIGLASVVRH